MRRKLRPPIRRSTGTGERVETVVPTSNWIQGILVRADPLTHRLAVPPLPQGGEGT